MNISVTDTTQMDVIDIDIAAISTETGLRNLLLHWGWLMAPWGTASQPAWAWPAKCPGCIGAGWQSPGGTTSQLCKTTVCYILLAESLCRHSGQLTAVLAGNPPGECQPAQW